MGQGFFKSSKPEPPHNRSLDSENKPDPLCAGVGLNLVKNLK